MTIETMNNLKGLDEATAKAYATVNAMSQLRMKVCNGIDCETCIYVNSDPRSKEWKSMCEPCQGGSENNHTSKEGDGK